MKTTKEPEQIVFLKEMSNFIFRSKYPKYQEELKRRENLEETANRSLNMHLKKFAYLNKKQKDEIRWAFDFVKQKKVMPSMRSMQFGGAAIEAKNTRIYNCASKHIHSIRCFAESFWMLLCGTGDTFGLSKRYIDRLPQLVTADDKTGTVLSYVIEDTIEGWSDAVEALLLCYFKNTAFTGRKIVFDYSRIRKKGTPLKTGGGKAPGHKGLKQSLERIKALLDRIIEEEGVKKLRPIHAYDILMHCADAVLSGGIRRAACATIFEKEDVEMMMAKTNFAISSYRNFEKINEHHYNGFVFYNGKKVEVTLKDYEYEHMKKHKEISWNHIEPQRARSNNSVILIRGKVPLQEFQKIVKFTSQWGEPGFVWANNEDVLYNPCFEIGFIPITTSQLLGTQFCNLTTVNGGLMTTLEEWKQAAIAATIIGTLQAAYTDFDYLTESSKEITEEEALLGVSLTGWFDNPDLLLNPENQYMVAKLCVKTNREWAKIIGINPAARVTCVKPEGTSSLVLETSSGAHPHHDHKYFRRIQVNKQDPVYKFFKSHNPHMCEESVWSATASDDCVTFPVTVPDHAIVKNDITAIDHLSYIRTIQNNWVRAGISESNKKNVSHNVSCTVEVSDTEWDKVVEYIYENQDDFAAVSLLPKTGDKTYEQSPLQRVYPEDEEYWKMLVEKYVAPDYDQMTENEDTTVISDTVACAGGVCDVSF